MLKSGEFKPYSTSTLKGIFLLFLIILSTMNSFSLTLIESGKSSYVIVLARNPAKHELKAAQVLQQYLQEISGVLIPIKDDSTSESPFEIVLGSTQRTEVSVPDRIINDGFIVETRGNKLQINGKGKGTLYGVYTLLEDYLGCRKYTSDYKFIPKKEKISLPEISDLQNPVFSFRSLHYFDAETDQEYIDWHKLNRIEDQWGLWGHSFFKLLSPSVYFKQHPEYFSLVNGKRKAMQLCLTNPDVLKIVGDKLRDLMADEPEMNIWSVSQNDDIGACECENCSALNKKHQSYQGSLLTFVNQLAERFPEKKIATMAYNFSRKSPVGIKPLENVIIFFSTIDINRAKPVQTDPRSEVFRKEYEAWSALASSVFVWDYVVQFSNYFSPFPNLNTLKPNFDYLSGFNPSGFFIQGSVEVSGELAGLRSYILAKLLWNPKIDVEKTKEEFLNSYYGIAAPLVKNYLDLIHQNADKSWKRMDIYDNPVIPFNTYLKKSDLLDYESILDSALQLVEHDPVLLKRVEMLSLTIQFAILQQSKFYGIDDSGVFSLDGKGWKVHQSVRDRLNKFLTLANRYGITQLNESGLSPEQYQSEWEVLFKAGPDIHKALNKPIKLITPNHDDFSGKGAETLVDGAVGSEDFQFNWLGWNGENMVVLIDLQEIMKISNLKMSFLENQRFYMFLPKSIHVEVSSDGEKFKQISSIYIPDPVQGAQNSIQTFNLKFRKTKTRYVKVTAINQPSLPEWRFRSDRKPWILTDEVMVD